MQLESAPIDNATRNGHAWSHALSSAVIPGLGQLLQGRFLSAAIQFGTVVSYMVAAFGLGGRRVMLLALFWNVWSIVDAYRHEDPARV